MKTTGSTSERKSLDEPEGGLATLDSRAGEAVLRAVMEGTSTSSGVDFFPAIVENLARALDMRIATVGLLDTETGAHVDTLAVWIHPSLQENMRYELAGTPCENVIGGGTCLYLDHVQEKFPADEMLSEMGVHCYVGTPLVAEDGTSLGVLNVLDDRPMAKDRVAIATTVLEIFASRAVTELDRIGAHEELLQHKQRLEELVEERTKELRSSQERLLRSERLASLGTLASGIAHEINNPLGIIRFASDSIRLDPGSPETAEQSAGLIIDNVERCRQIIQSVLRFARSEPSERSSIDINDCIGRAVDVSRGDAALNHVEITSYFGENLPATLGNDTELQQVFVNLIGNAVVAQGVSTILVTSCVEGDRLCVAVHDNGAGIREADLPFVFDPFFTTRQQSGGTGLGLSICHGIIRDHGGQIDVVQPETGGCTFRVELPVVA